MCIYTYSLPMSSFRSCRGCTRRDMPSGPNTLPAPWLLSEIRHQDVLLMRSLGCSAGDCPKTLCSAGVHAGQTRIPRRVRPARRRRYKTQMQLFSEFSDSNPGATNRNQASSLPCFVLRSARVRISPGMIVGTSSRVCFL